MQRILMLTMLVLLLFGSAALAASDDGDVKTTIEALKARIRDQNNRLAELESQVAEQKVSLAEVAKGMGADAAERSCPGWLENLKFQGDLRLRYQNDCLSDCDSDTKDRNRLRFRLRFGFTKTWLDDQMLVGFRLASGSSSDPTSTNQTFTNNFSTKNIWIDRAYVKYAPNCLPGLTVMGGKVPNPLVYTDMVWDKDVNPEGVWLQYAPECGNITPFANFGYWILSENFESPTGSDAVPYTLRDAILVTYQGGVHVKIAKDIKYTFAAAWYDFDHYDVAYTNAYGNDEFSFGGTDRLAARGFGMVNVINKIKFRAFDLPMAGYLDWIYNCHERDDQVGWRNQNCALAVGMKVGQNKKKGDWSVGYKYAYIEANAIAGGFGDSDFGYANRKGHVFKGVYNLTDFLTLAGKVYWTRPVVDVSGNCDVVRTQVDIVWKF